MLSLDALIDDTDCEAAMQAHPYILGSDSRVSRIALSCVF